MMGSRLPRSLPVFRGQQRDLERGDFAFRAFSPLVFGKAFPETLLSGTEFPSPVFDRHVPAAGDKAGIPEIVRSAFRLFSGTRYGDTIGFLPETGVCPELPGKARFWSEQVDGIDGIFGRQPVNVKVLIHIFYLIAIISGRRRNPR